MWYFHNSSIIGLLIIHLYNCYCRVPKEISAICGQYYPMNIFCHGYLLRKKKNINHLLRKMRNILPSKLIAYIYMYIQSVFLLKTELQPFFLHLSRRDSFTAIIWWFSICICVCLDWPVLSLVYLWTWAVLRRYASSGIREVIVLFKIIFDLAMW